MTTLIVHDGRTDAERAYDALKDGSAYAKPASCTACAEPTAPGAAYCDACGAPVAPANPSPLLTSLIAWAGEEMAAEQPSPWSGVIDILTNRKPATSQDDQLIGLLSDMYGDEQAIAAWIDGPAQLQIERHTTNADDEPADDPWTTYALGEAEIDIHDAGGGNLCVGQHMITFSKDDGADLLDLALLLSNPTVQQALGRADENDTTRDSSEDEDETDEEEDEEARREAAPVPPVPAGYPIDKPMISNWDHDIYMVIDRRDGEMAICHRGEIGATILPPEFTIALWRFFDQKPIEELIVYHWREQMRQTGSPELNSLLDWVDEHFKKEAAAK